MWYFLHIKRLLSVVINNKDVMDKQHVEKDLIIELIIKKSTVGLDNDESEVLNSWLNQSVSNRDLYNKLSSEDYVEKRTRDLKLYNVQAGWSKVHRVINKQHKIKPKISSLWVKVSGIAATLLIAIGAYFLAKKEPVPEVGIKYAAVYEHIQPGTNKALLTLSNGNKIELTEIDTAFSVNGAHINIDSSTVSYTNSIAQTKEISYNTLTTPRGGSYKIRLSDGTLVWLNAQSELRYPETFVGDNRTVYVKGEVYFEVAKDKSKPFYVFSNDNVIKVLGTAFSVKAYEDSKESFVTLCEGSIQLSSNGQRDILKPNQQAVVTQQNTIINKVNAQNYTAWKDNMFLYRSARLHQILDDLSRWYNTEIFYTNPKLKDLKFSMRIKRYESIASIINMIETTGEVKFRFENNILIVNSR